MHQLWIVWGWPNGIVVGNLLAALIQGAIVALGLFLCRNLIGPRLVAWLHKHHLAHLERLASEVSHDRTPSQDQD